ncbi:lactonase family protein [Terriglobus tenax]|uniref:lactonase family protein n=1 Tax=Terriglobus tenax TaxID=1111115 RepID=UPI0021E0236C|nr:lactonase family protein [Terriglobus tenax]
MKWSKLGRTALATVVSLGMGLGITACSRDYVVAFLYVPSSGSSEGLINAYQVSFQVGALMQMSTSPVSTGYRNPVALSATSDGKYVYVVHRDDSKIVQYAVGTDGKLYGQNTYDSIGSSTYPVALNITPDNAFIYVLNTYQPGYSSASTGPGNITVYKVSSTDGSLTAQPSLTVNIGYAPVSVVTSTYNNFLYVVQQDTTAGNRNLLGFTRNTTTGALTPLSGTTLGNGTTTVTSGYYSGVTPSSVVEDPRSRFLYVTDRDSNQVIGYTLGSTGVPALITSSPWSTGLRPLNATIDPRGYYLYTANYGANSVSAYSIDQSTGALTGSATSSSTTVGTGPQCVTIEPALGKYMFTANYLDNTTSGLQLDSHNGGLTNIQNSPFATSSRPSCALAIANGTHATQTVKP